MEESSEDKTTQYLTFTINNETYALKVINVKEVLEFTTVSKVPRMPDFMRGIINLRGSVVPVVDLKMKFGMGETEKAIDTSIIVTEVLLDDELVTMGLLTDSVKEVIEMSDEEIEPTPYIGTKIDTDFIKGMGRKNDIFLIVLNIEKVLTVSEINMVSAQEEKAE
ncbi:MAG: chemotaxis protein CheW [Spirochaetaceae bacterium 4572_59]|nr:MAG: chemotaxis protein CheW [Spirochaetaceae bacterium 4572_59]